MPFRIIRNDITRVRADAIVNTANPDPVCGSGTDAAIYQAAGRRRLLFARRKIGPIAPGEAAVTKGYKLPARYIIHTVGPAWVDGTCGEYETLAACYRKSLLLAEQLGCQSIAFPLISTGVYGFPKQEALQIALRTIKAFLEQSEMDVTLVVFDRTAFDLSGELVAHVEQYISERYVTEKRRQEHRAAQANGYVSAPPSRRRQKAARRWQDENAEERPLETVPMEDFAAPVSQSADAVPLAPTAGKSLSDVMAQVGESFQERLLRLIDERGMKDSWVYKRANVDRKLFSKIRCNPNYHPRKQTAVALAIALELNLDETVDLLCRAEMALSPSSRFDLIIQYCIENGIYDIYEINALLFEYGQPLLGC